MSTEKVTRVVRFCFIFFYFYWRQQTAFRVKAGVWWQGTTTVTMAGHKGASLYIYTHKYNICIEGHIVPQSV